MTHKEFVMKKPINLLPSLTILVLLGLVACNRTEETPVPEPTAEDAAFSFSYDPDNPNKVMFTATSDVEAWYTHWAFGDNTAAEGMQAEKTYPLSGEYQVRFKVFTEGGTAESFQSVTIEKDIAGPNLLQNGELEGEDFWTRLPISDGMEVTFANGEATWQGGNWGHIGIYQAMEVEANQVYQIEMEIRGNALTDSWFEVYAGRAEPTPNEDYTDGGIRMGLNTWEGCGNEAFSGLLTTLACTGSDGTFAFPTAGTVYLVIRGGGVDYGSEGVTIDNISVRPL